MCDEYAPGKVNIYKESLEQEEKFKQFIRRTAKGEKLRKDDNKSPEFEADLDLKTTERKRLKNLESHQNLNYDTRLNKKHLLKSKGHT